MTTAEVDAEIGEEEAVAEEEIGIRVPARSTRQPVLTAEKKPWFRSSPRPEDRFTARTVIPKGEQTAISKNFPRPPSFNRKEGVFGC